MLFPLRSSGKALIHNDVDVLEVVIPARRTPAILGLVTVLIGGVVWMDVEAVRAFSLSASAPPSPFLLGAAYFATYAILNFFVLDVASWVIGGSERLSLRSDTLTIKRLRFGLGWSRHYRVADIVALRVSPLSSAESLRTYRRDFFGLYGGPVAFVYRGRSHRLGASLDLSGASAVVEVMRTSQPDLDRPSPQPTPPSRSEENGAA